MEVNLNECKCICENAEIVQEVAIDIEPVHIFLAVVVIIITIVLFIIGFKKLKSDGNGYEENNH